MIKPPDHVKRYRSAKERFLKPAIMQFFAREFPKLFGPFMREKIADELLALFAALAPETSRLKPGQMLWSALDKNTRGDSPKRRFVPVVLTVIADDDVAALATGARMSRIAEGAVARMIREAYQQGGILSSRDLGLITLRQPAWASEKRRRFEKENDCVLPHTGALHDMGSTLTHKAAIVRKTVFEGKDPVTVARECNHTQRAVDRYLKDYHRVKILHKLGHDLDFIHMATKIAKHVIIQYVNLIKEEPNAQK